MSDEPKLIYAALIERANVERAEAQARESARLRELFLTDDGKQEVLP
jgi:hypothetical protein